MLTLSVCMCMYVCVYRIVASLTLGFLRTWHFHKVLIQQVHEDIFEFIIIIIIIIYLFVCLFICLFIYLFNIILLLCMFLGMFCSTVIAGWQASYFLVQIKILNLYFGPLRKYRSFRLCLDFSYHVNL